jgi:anthranilate phosphoribosyltransferase
VVHSTDGLDEISCAAATRFADWQDGKVTEGEIKPEDLGMDPVALEKLKVSSPAESLEMARTVISGEDTPARQAVILNAGAAIMVSGRAADLREGMELACKAIASGAAADLVEKVATLSNA